MSINVTNSNKIDIVKLALQKKGKVAVESKKPEYLQMTGSIFNAPKNTDSLVGANTKSSLSDLVQRMKRKDDSNTENKVKDKKPDGDVTKEDGEKQTDEVKALTSQSKKDASLVNTYSDQAQKLDKNIEKSDKSFTKTLQKQQAQLKKDNKKIEKTVKENNEMQKEVLNAQKEVETLMAANSFSMGSGDSAQGPSAQVLSNQDRINELRELIGSKTALMQANGKTIYSLQRSSTKTLKRMDKTNKNYIKTQNQNIKDTEQRQSTTDKIIKFAGRLDKYSQLAITTGETLQLTGSAMIAAGHTPHTAWMIPVGQGIQKTGVITKTIGQYGQTAANVTKSAAFAASGNLMGAMQSAVAAYQSGAAAKTSTKQLKTEFTKIDAAAKKSTQMAAANEAAKQEVEKAQEDAIKKAAEAKGIKTDGLDNKEIASHLSKEEIKNAKTSALGGLKEKDARKYISADLQNKMASGEIATDKSGVYKQINQLKSNARLETETIDGKKSSFAGRAFGNAKSEFKSYVNDAGGSIDANGVVTGITKADRKQINSQINGSFKNVASETTKSTGKTASTKGDLLSSMGTTLNTTAALFGQTKGTQPAGVASNKKASGRRPQYQINARTQRIMESVERDRARAARRYA